MRTAHAAAVRPALPSEARGLRPWYLDYTAGDSSWSSRARGQRPAEAALALLPPAPRRPHLKTHGFNAPCGVTSR